MNLDKPHAAASRVRMLGLRELCQTTGLSRSMIYKRLAEREADPVPFPRPVKIGAKVLWRQSTIEAYIDRLERQAAKEG